MSSVTRNTTHQSTDNITRACQRRHAMLIVQPDLCSGGTIDGSTDKRSEQDDITPTFALIRILVKNCLCGYNFSIPEGGRREGERKNKALCY